MAYALIPVPDKLQLSGSKSLNFELFEQSWKNYELATGLKDKPEEQRLATLLSIIGNEGLVVYNAFTWSYDETRSVDSVLYKFEKYCKPKLNETYERYIFNSRKQKPTESIDEYIVELRNMIRNCNYGGLTDSLLRDALVMGIRNSRMRMSLLKETCLDLDKCIHILRATERAIDHAAIINKSDEPATYNDDVEAMEINKIQNRSNRQGVDCKFCGFKHAMSRDSCPAFGKSCNKCRKPNHFSKVCKSQEFMKESRKRVNQVVLESDYEEDFTIE